MIIFLGYNLLYLNHQSNFNLLLGNTMKNLLFGFIIISMAAFTAFAGDTSMKEEGKLTPEIIAEIQGSFKLDAHTRTAINALQKNDIRDLVKGFDVHDSLDFIFSHEFDIKGMTDQKSSGRCWIFAAFNIHRQKVAEKYNLDDFEFSSNFAMFWDKMEKANMFLEYVILNPTIDTNDREFVLLLKTPLPDGGFFSMAADCIMKHGAVPQEIMPESESSNKTSRMNQMITRKLRIFAFELRDMYEGKKSIKKMRARKVEMLKEVYRMLALNLGVPPTEFQWRYTDKDGNMGEVKTYTPTEFWQEVTDGVDLRDYVVLGHCPTQPLGKNYRIILTREQVESTDWTFLNMEMKVLKEYAHKILADTIPVQFSVDMGRQMDSKAGLMAQGVYDYESFYGVGFDFDKKVGIYSRDSAPNHSMVLVGYDEAEGKVAKWKIENSWGTDRGDDGFFLMTDEWFDLFGYSIVLHKDNLSPEHLELTKTKPVDLPFWDPLARIAQVGGYLD